jgi:YVTN family beta-propeller protein
MEDQVQSKSKIVSLLIFVCLLTTLIFGALPLKVAQAEGITTTLSMSAAGTKVAIDPVLNKVYVLNPPVDIVTVIDGSTHTQTTIATGQNPADLALNPATGKVYIANRDTNNVTVLNGTDNTTVTVATGGAPNAIAINPTTNRIYVTCASDNVVTVIDGVTNVTSTIALHTGANPRTVVVNPVTDKIYVINDGDYSITVIDGSTKATTIFTPISIAPYPFAYAAAVNPITNKLYVVNNNLGTVSVIDGNTLAVTQVAVGAAPNFVAVNPVTNKIYVACADGNSVTIINGSDNTTTSIGVGANPFAMTINPTTNQIYVASWSSTDIWRIDGNTNTLVSTITTTGTPNGIAINPITNQLYAASMSDLIVVDGTSNTVTNITSSWGSSFWDMAFNSITNQLYIAYQGNTITAVDGNTHVTTAIPTGKFSIAVDVNPVTNKIYTADWDGKSITIIDGATYATTTLGLPFGPTQVAVNPVTNKIYADLHNSQGLAVVDGSTNVVSVINPTYSDINKIVVNPVTNRIYLLSYNNLYVLDGATNSLLGSVYVGNSNDAEIAINIVTNKIYVTISSAPAVGIIDGSTLSLTTRATGSLPFDVAVNSLTNKIYIPSRNDGVMTVLDGATNTTQTISGLPKLFNVIVNPITNKIYVSADSTTTQVVMIDGITNMATLISGTNTSIERSSVNLLSNQIYISSNKNPSATLNIINEQNVQNLPLTVEIALSADHITHTRTPTFSFTPTSAYSPANPAIQNVFYQVDTWTGPWLKATHNAGLWSGTTHFLQIGPHVMYTYTSNGLESGSFDPSYANAQPVGKISAYGFYVMPPDILYVDDDYTAATTDWNYDHFASITSAIQAAYANSTIVINSGTYNETITLTKELTLKPAGTATLTGSLTLNTGTFAPDPSSSLTVTGNFTQGAGTTNLGSGTLVVTGNFTQTTGTFNLNTGTLALGNAFTHSGGTFNVDAGTLTLNGHATQVIPSGITPYNLNIQTTDDGLVGYWPMDEGSGATTTDASGNGNPITLNNAIWAHSYAPVQFINPSALDLDSTSYIQAPHANPALDFGANQDFSITMWVKKSVLASPYANILSNRSDIAGSHPGFALTTDQYADRWVATLSDGTHTAQVSGGLIADQQWHHLVATFDRDGMLTLYQDGAFVANTSITGVTNITTGLPLSIGNYTASSNTFAGTLDDLRIYNRLLSANDRSILSGGLKPGSVTLSEALDVNGSLGIGSRSTLDVSTTNCSGSACSIHLAGNWNNNGDFYPRSGAVYFDGNSTIGGASISSFFDIFLEAASSLTAPPTNFNVLHDFTNLGGTFNPNGGTVTFNGASPQTLPANAPFFNLSLQPTDPDLVGYWKLDDGSGLTAVDSSGHDNHGVLYGDYSNANYPVWSSQHAPLHSTNNQSLQFNRTTSQRVEAPLVSTAKNNITLSAWVNLDAGDPSAYHTILYNGRISDSNGAGLILDNTHRMWFYVSGTMIKDTLIDIPIGTWTHVAAVGDAGNRWSFYQNGVLISGPFDLTGVGFQTPTSSTTIGNLYNYGYNQPMEGLLDEVRFYNRALSADEIAALGSGYYPNQVTLSQSLDVNGNLTLTNATLDVSATACSGNPCPITLAGNWTNNGSFNPHSGSVTFDGGQLQTLNGTGTNDFATLSISGAATIVADQSTPAATAVTFSASPNGARLRRIETIGGSGLQTFGLTGVSIDVILNSFSAIQVERVQGNHPDANSTGLRTGQYWTITPSGTGTVNLTLPQNGLTGVLSVCRYLDPTAPGNHWDCVPADTSTLATATRNGVSSFSDWTVGSDVTPTAIHLNQFEAHSAAPENVWLLGLGAMTLLVLVLIRKIH